MNIHLFSATSAPNCAQFSSLQSAEKQRDDFDKKVRLLMQRNFPIDNCLFAASIVDEAAHFIEQESTLFQNKGFNLTNGLQTTNLCFKFYLKLIKPSCATWMAI